MLVRYFVKCPSVGICLLFSQLDWGYGFGGGRSSQGQVPFSSAHRKGTNSQQALYWCRLCPLARAVSSFSTVEVLPPPHSLLCSLEGSHWLCAGQTWVKNSAPQGWSIHVTQFKKFLGVGSRDRRVRPRSAVLRSSCFLEWLYHFAFPLAMHEHSCCPASLPEIDIASCLLDFNHSNSCSGVSYF